MRSVIVIGVGLLCLCVGHGLAEAPPPAEKTAPAVVKWEYRTLTRTAIADLANKDFAAGLNKLGDEGWEMVAYAPPISPQIGPPAEYYFKRPKARAGAVVGGVAPPRAEAQSEDWVILKLKSASAVDFAKTADEIFGGKGGGLRVLAEPTTNSVLARGSARQIEELRRLISVMDVPEASAGAAPVARLEVLRLKYAKVTDFVKVLQDLHGKDGRAYRMSSDERTNSLILSGPPAQLEQIRGLLVELDVATPKDGDRKTP
jgi:hypothetical protein